MDNEDTKEIEILQKKAATESWIALGFGILGVFAVWVITWSVLWWCFSPSGDDFYEKASLAWTLIQSSDGASTAEILKILDEPKWIEAGTFGDMFGCLNTLLTGFAFAGLVATLIRERGNMRVERKKFEIQEKHYKEQQREALKKELDASMFHYAEYIRLLLKDIPEEEYKKVMDNVRAVPEMLEKLREKKIPYTKLTEKMNEMRSGINSYAEPHLIFSSWIDRIENIDDLKDVPSVKCDYIARLWKMNKSNHMFIVYLCCALDAPDTDNVWGVLKNSFSDFSGVRMFFSTYKYDDLSKDVLFSILQADQYNASARVSLEEKVVKKVIIEVFARHGLHS